MTRVRVRARVRARVRIGVHARAVEVAVAAENGCGSRAITTVPDAATEVNELRPALRAGFVAFGSSSLTSGEAPRGGAAAREPPGGRAVRAHRGRKEAPMLDVYYLAVQLVRDLKPLHAAVARSDPDHARQMRKACKAVPLLIAEGSGSRDRNRKARYNLAPPAARSRDFVKR